MTKQLQRQQRMDKIREQLNSLFPAEKTETALQYNNVWELLIAVMLSAQCTDKRVNSVTPALFRQYPTPKAMAAAPIEKLEQLIFSTGFYKNKAKNMKAAAKRLTEEYSQEVPQTMEDLITLAGVGRKTANVVLGNAFQKHEGIAVDTHVRRFMKKFELTDNDSPEKIEQELMKMVPKEEWATISHQFILYGREVCTARKHECEHHALTKIYPKAAKNWPKAKSSR